MTHCRQSLPVLFMLGALGPLAGWADATPAASPQAAPGAALQTSAEDFRARIIELRGRQQERPNDPELSYALGALYLDLGDPAAAEEQLRRAIDSGTDRPDTWILLGKAWLAQDKLVEIQAQIPADQLPGATEKAGLAVLQGLAWLAKGRPADARDSFQEALSLSPDYSPAYVGLARASLAEGNLDAAGDALQSASKSKESDPMEIAVLAGDLAAARKEFATAERAYQDAVDLKPYQSWRLRQVAQMQIAQDKLDAADANLAKVLAERKGDRGALYLQALSAYQRGDYQRAYNTAQPLLGGRVDEPGALFIAGASAHHQGQDQQARELLGLYLDRNPGHRGASRLLAATLIRLGEPADALDLLRPVLEQDNPTINDYALAGTAAVMAGANTDGIAYLERAQAMNPADKRLARMLAAAKAGAGDGAAGVAELERIVAEGGEGLEDLELALMRRRLNAGETDSVIAAARLFQERYPNRADGWVYAGVARMRSGATEEASRDFQHALEMSPDNLDALIGMADVRLREGDAQAAAESILRSLRQQPTSPLLLGNLIEIAKATGDPNQAVDWIKPLQSADPTNQVLASALARAYTESGQPLAGIEFIQARTDASDSVLMRELGFAQLRAGQRDAAVGSFRQITQDNPESARAMLDLAGALEETGQMDEAGKLYEQAEAIAPNLAAARIGSARTALFRVPVPVKPGSFERALEKVAAAVQRHPNDPDARRLRALALLAAGKPKDAAERLTVIYAGSQGARDAILLARAHLYADDPKAAVEVLVGHVGRYPEDIEVRWALAQIYLGEEAFSEAAEQLTQMVSLDWSRTDAHLDLALALAKSGRKDDAMTHLRAAKAANPAEPRVKELEAMLGK